MAARWIAHLYYVMQFYRIVLDVELYLQKEKHIPGQSRADNVWFKAFETWYMEQSQIIWLFALCQVRILKCLTARRIFSDGFVRNIRSHIWKHHFPKARARHRSRIETNADNSNVPIRCFSYPSKSSASRILGQIRL